MLLGLTNVDLWVLLAYLALVVGLGCGLMRKAASSEQFMAAGRSLPGWVVGLSIFGTFVSSISFLANPGKSYADNWNPFVFGLSLPLAAWIATRFFVPFYRHGGEVSAYTHLEHRFGLWARTYAVVCFLLMQLARVATILYLVALALSPLLGWSVPTIIIMVGVLVTIYTLLGGIEAVIWTDVAQSIVLTAGIVLAIVIVLVRIPGGPAEVFAVAVEQNKFSLGSMGTSLVQSTFWVVLLHGLFINLQNFAVDQSYVQRYVTARSDSAAKQSVWLGALLYLPISALLFFVGTALYAFYQAQPDLLPTTDMKPDAVFPHFIVHQLPVGITGLLIAAILAAAMSSVDSSLNCSATLVLCDIYKRYIHPAATDRESMVVLYAVTLLGGLLGTGAGLWMMNAESVLDVWWQMASVASGGLLGLVVLGRISRRVRSGHALFGVCCGVAVILWMTLSTLKIGERVFWPEKWGALRSEMHPFLIIVVGTLTVLATGLTAAWLFPRKENHRP